jgi:hypothetical protein
VPLEISGILTDDFLSLNSGDLLAVLIFYVLLSERKQTWCRAIQN